MGIKEQLEERRRQQEAKRYFRQNNDAFFDAKKWAMLIFSGLSISLACGFLYGLFVSIAHIHFQFILALVGIAIASTRKKVAHIGNTKVAWLSVIFYVFALYMSHVFVIVISMSSMIGGGSFFALLLEPDIYRLGFQSFASNHVLTILIFVLGGYYTYEIAGK